MKAAVTIDAFEDMTVDGLVTKVNEYPEPTGWFNSTVKKYVVFVQILTPPKDLKTGLTAKVRIHTQHLPNALQVPIQAIHRHQGRYYCMVKDGDTWRPMPVTLGSSNEKTVVISEGLTEKDFVAPQSSRADRAGKTARRSAAHRRGDRRFANRTGGRTTGTRAAGGREARRANNSAAVRRR